MSEERHVFAMTSVWNGDSDGQGSLEAEGRVTEYTRPWQLGGPKGKTNPEEFLVAAVVSCYCITLAVMAEGRRVPLTRIEMEAEGDVIRGEDKRLKFTAIRLKPTLHLDGADEKIQTKALDMALKAEAYCLISNAMRGNVEITVEPSVA